MIISPAPLRSGQALCIREPAPAFRKRRRRCESDATWINARTLPRAWRFPGLRLRSHKAPCARVGFLHSV